MYKRQLKEALDRGVVNRNEFRKAIQYPTSDDTDLEIHTVLTDIMPLSEALDENFSLDEPLNDTSLGKPTAGDSQKAGFDPNQPRANDGEWTDGGGDFNESVAKDEIRRIFDEVSFRRFGNAFRRHINPHFSQDGNLSGGQIGGRQGMTWSELASFIIGDGDYSITEQQFNNFMDEFGKNKDWKDILYEATKDEPTVFDNES